MKIRVRFAPAPTGMMHLGNVRTALLNYLFAKKKNGTFIMRLEDTDPERNFDPGGKQIIQELHWLGLSYDEGPDKGGPYAPYIQSQRTKIYEEKLTYLKDHNAIYRCFCTQEELQKKRNRQQALKLPPRYDRTCLLLSPAELEKKLAQEIAFIWRFKVPDNEIIEVQEISRKTMQFKTENFSDFPISRSDGTFTFIFSNAIDDMVMHISHVLRGEDHLTNTVNQIMIMQAFNVQAPFYWHLPILCNVEGKKLSKRDFGFSLFDLKKEGYLSEAINNYLAILGGGSFEHELMDMQELIKAMDFDNIKTTGNIKYDAEKLTWFNHKWIERYDPIKLAKLVMPLLQEHYAQASNLEFNTIVQLSQAVKSEMNTLNDIIPALNFYFNEPILTKKIILEHIPDHIEPILSALIKKHGNSLYNPEQFIELVKKDAKEAQIPNKLLFASLRLMLTGSIQGSALIDILTILGPERCRERIQRII